MPVLGIIFLRHAANRFDAATRQIAADQASGKMPKRKIQGTDWSLTPGRYVGVAAAEVNEDFDFKQTITEIHEELAGLNVEAVELAAAIQTNLEKLGV